MEYKKIIIDGYILGVVTVKNGNIGKDEYEQITEIIHSRPTAPDGYTYKLRADTLAWELYELPIIEEEQTAEQLAEMTNAELSAILADMGVSAVMDKDNMIDLILYKQKGE